MFSALLLIALAAPPEPVAAPTPPPVTATAVVEGDSVNVTLSDGRTMRLGLIPAGACAPAAAVDACAGQAADMSQRPHRVRAFFQRIRSRRGASGC